MEHRLIFLLVGVLYLLMLGTCQVLPYYSASKYFYANEATAIVGSGSGIYSIPATFPISTASHRLPFYAVMQASNLKTELDEFMYFWTQLTAFTSSSFQMSMYFLKRTLGTTYTYFGFQAPSNVKFRYLLVLNTFPNKYMSVAVLMGGLAYNIAAGSFKTISINVPSLVTPAPVILSATDTVFIHSFTDITLASNKSPLDSSFQVTLSFSVLNSTDFAVKISAKYPVTLKQLQVKVFIYNKADFDNLFVKIDYQKFTYSNLAVGTSSFLTQSYTAPFTPALTTDIFFGIQGIQLSKYANTGFQFTIASTGGATYDIKLSNLWETSTIPCLDLLVLLASQFRCPNLQLLIDVTLKICYNTSCPTSTFKSTQVLGVTGIYVCKACISTCHECVGVASNCTSCYAAQNREKVGTSCVPMAGFYEALVDVAPACDSNCLTCSKSAKNCTTCDPSMYLSATNVCVTCSSAYVGCLTCTSSKCTLCDKNYVLDPSGISCKPCSSYSNYCLTCDNSKCLSCNTTAGYILNIDGSTCITCTTFDPKCVTCTSSGCTGCDTAGGYFLNSESACVSCQSYDTQCSTCDSLSCLTCSSGYFLNPTGSCTNCQSYNSLCLTCDSSSCLSCSYGNFLTSTGACQSCSAYDLKCADCNSTSCITCTQGYTVYQSKCQNLNPICGDGQWIETLEPCDDGNLLNNDGCNSQCQVEQDYQCLLTDKLPSGASFCKYTQNLTVDFNSMQKDISSNKLHVFLNIGPSTFKQWTKESIMSLISPVQIVDSQTGTVKQIPPQNINLVYHENQQTGQVQLVIDYGQNNLQDSSLRLNIRPDLTNLSALRDMQVEKDLLMKLNSQGNGFYLYDYPPETYQTQNLIQNLSFLMGILSLFFSILGFCMPAGKLIVLQALAVIQIGYFSLLQFDRIPPTFAGLKSLNLCNGFNDLSIFSSSSHQIRQNIFKVIGLKTIALSNYNISLILFVFLPALVGLIGFLVKRNGKNVEYQKVRRNSNASQDGKDEVIPNETPTIKNLQNDGPSLGRVIFERILYENTFYGLLFGGYIGFISIFHSFSQPQIFDYVFMSLIAILWIGYGYLYTRSQNKQIDLREFNQKSPSKYLQTKKDQDLKTFTQFGQFADVHQQLMPAAQSMFMKKIYLFFMGQRMMNSIILVFLPGMLSFTSLILMGIYLLQFIGIIILYKKFQTDVSTKSKGSLFSYIYQNYVLRQSVNIFTIILIEALYFSVTIIVQSNGPYEAFVQNGLVTKGVPFAILSLLLLNIKFNIFCWVWELKSDRLFDKTKTVLALLFPNTFLSSLSPKKDLSISISDQEEVDRVMNKFMEDSSIFKCKQNPFLGIQEKESSKNALLDLLKVQQKIKIVLPESARNLKSTMINELWDQI